MKTINDIRVLLVEDDEVDIEIAKRQFQRSPLLPCLTIARNGREALDTMRSITAELSGEMRLVVLLDINMPIMNGHEFLTVVREDRALSQVVVFVLTTSSSERDLRAAYSKHVAGYIVKGSAEHREGLPSFLDNYVHLNTFPPICKIPA